MRVLTVTFLCLFTLGLTACDTDEGGAEETGERIDEMMTDTGNKVEDLCEDMKEEMKAENSNC